MREQICRIKGPLMLLLLLGVISFGGYSYIVFNSITKYAWLRELLLSFGGIFISIIITVVLINSYSSAREEVSREALKKRCLSSIKIPMRRICLAFSNICKAVYQENLHGKKMKYSDFFSSIQVEEFKYLNVSKPAPVHIDGGGEMPWLSYIVSNIKGFEEALDDFIIKYSIFLDEEIIAVYEEVKLLKIVDLLQSFPQKEPIHGRTGVWDFVLRDNDEESSCLKQYLLLLSKLSSLVLIEDGKEEVYEICWSNSCYPEFGSAREKEPVRK